MRSNRFANVLDEFTRRGDRVIPHTPRAPEHYVGDDRDAETRHRLGECQRPVGPDGIADRLDDCDARVVVTTTANREPIDATLDDAASVEHVSDLDRAEEAIHASDLIRIERDRASRGYEPIETAVDDATPA